MHTRFPTFVPAIVAGCLVGLPSAGAQTRLELSDAVRRALAGDSSFAVADLQRRSALARATSARGAFAPRAFAETSYGVTNVVTESSFLDDDNRFSEDVLRFGVGVGGRLPIGTRYALTLSTSRVDSDATSVALVPAYLTTAELSVTQPLLRGAFGAASAPIDVAELEGEAATATAEAAASDLALAVVVAYWQLAAAQNAETVGDEAVANAQAQLEATRLRIRAGRLSPLDETSAQATVAAQEDARNAARQEKTVRAAALLSLLVPREGRGDRVALDGLAASDAPRTPPTGAAPAVGSVLRRAMQKRPELRALRHLAKAAQRHADALDRDALPDLSVIGTIGAHGIAGDRVPPPSFCGDGTEPCPPLPAFFQGGLGQSYANAPDSPYFSVGARLEVPLPNGEASGRAEAAAFDARGRAAQLRQAEWQVEVEVRAGVRGLAEARARLQSAETAVRLAQESLEGEQRKFDAGVSTTFEVLRVAQSLALAKNARFSAIAALEIANARLLRDTGALLTDLGVSDAVR